MIVNLKRVMLLLVLVQIAVAASAWRVDFEVADYMDSIANKKLTWVLNPIEITFSSLNKATTSSLNFGKGNTITIKSSQGCRINTVFIYYDESSSALTEGAVEGSSFYDGTKTQDNYTRWKQQKANSVTEETLTNTTNNTVQINKITVSYYVPGPTFTPPAGKYSGAQTVTISTPWEGTIYYTTDGTEPSKKSTAYEGPISVSESMTIKATLRDPQSMTYSDTITAVYEIVEKTSMDVTMDEVVAGSVEAGTEVMVTDTLVGVQLVQYGEQNLVVARDLHEEEVTIPEGMTDYMRELAKKQTTAWNRNRWLLLDLGKDIDERDIVGHKITGVTGILTDVTNPTIQLTAAPVSGDEITTSTNHYILANFNDAYTKRHRYSHGG